MLNQHFTSNTHADGDDDDDNPHRYAMRQVGCHGSSVDDLYPDEPVQTLSVIVWE